MNEKTLKRKFPTIARLIAAGADTQPDCYAITREACALYRVLAKVGEKDADEPAEPFYEGARSMVNYARPIRGVTR